MKITKRYIRTYCDDIYAYEPIMAMATINPKLCNSKSVRLEVVQGGEGNNPHIHVYHKDGSVSYVDLTKPAYAEHHKNDRRKVKPLSKKQLKDFVEIMKTVWDKYAIEINELDENGNPTGNTYFVKATGYEAAVQIWTDTYGGEERFSYYIDGRPVMPNYETLETHK